jgi:UPF0755 protein
MSDLGLALEDERRVRRRRRGGLGCLAVLVALALLVGGAFVVGNAGINAIKDRLAPPPDYTGGGTGSVMVEVKEGDAADDIAGTLMAKDVVKSEDAFVDAAKDEPASLGIQVGFYALKKQMSAAAALAVLIDPANVVQASVGFPEGWTLDQVVAELVEKTRFSAREYDAVLRRPASIGLPSYAEGNAEGYLFPATYAVKPDATPRSLLAAMVSRYEQAATKLDLVERSEALGVDPHDVMTVASLVQSEARRAADFPKVSRVIYNRLDEPMALQLDSTVHYAVGRDGSVGTSDEERNVDSPYNTYRNRGLPPTPISAPGERAIAAALAPAKGSWLYFVTTNPDTGRTEFNTSYRDHLDSVAEFQQWCADSDTC